MYIYENPHSDPDKNGFIEDNISETIAHTDPKTPTQTQRKLYIYKTTSTHSYKYNI